MKQDVALDHSHPGPSWRALGRFIALGGVVTIALTMAAVRWVDLPLALWIHGQGLDGHLWMRTFLDTPIIATPIAVIYALVYVARRARSRPSRAERDWFLVSLTLLVSLQVKSVLKLTFGRTWPREVMNVSISGGGSAKSAAYDCVSTHGYINDGIHLFNFFHGSEKQFAAFPSGSTASLVAMVIPIMAMYPKLRWPLMVFSAVSMCFFILTNTHFLADVIAGLYVGVLCGGVCVAMRNDDLAAGR